MQYEGPGEAGNFLGIPCELAEARVCILPAPLEASTSFGKGTALGPQALIEASRNVELFDCETEKEVFSIGIHTSSPVLSDTPEGFMLSLENRVAELLKQEKFVVTLGGEHTVSAAPIRACAEHFGKISVLQFDAHTDLRLAYEGNPLSHASVMARAKECPRVQNVVAVGIRAMDKSEFDGSIREDIFFDHEIQADPEWIPHVLERLSDRVYVTFDIDVFDAGFMPSTGTPEPGGLSWFHALALLREVSKKRDVVGFDLVELMPLSGFSAPNFVAAKLVYKFLNYRFG
ncbi:MAG: agmatinase [Bdellovibrionales bacterium]|nr:agmatinase [Bdellovibrionales bacterium]